MSVLISTIYKGTAVIQAIKLFSPSKVYFIVDDPLNSTRENAIKMIKDIFPEISYETVPQKIYDIVSIAGAVIDLIEKEKKQKIVVHISEGRKTMSLGLLLGAYVKKKIIDSVYYITEETNTPIKLPLIEFRISSKKRKILEKINEDIGSINELEEILDVKSQTIYVHLKELRDDGFLDKNNKLTEVGKIVLLNGAKDVSYNNKSDTHKEA